MKLLNGKELAEYIKERQMGQVRALRQAHGIAPRLAIIRANPDPVVDSYMKLKRSYGEDIDVDVDVHTIEQKEVLSLIKKLNKDETIHGIIVQLPLPDPEGVPAILDAVASNKDVDGLGAKPDFEPATPMAITWLLAGFNVELKAKKIVIVGNGRLVGRPLAAIWKASGLDVTVLDKSIKDITPIIKEADILIGATGVAGLITKDMVKSDAVIVDAGVATDKNGLVGDIAPDVRTLDNITITPEKGGVGPLTVCALFDNVIRAARRSVEA